MKTRNILPVGAILMIILLGSCQKEDNNILEPNATSNALIAKMTAQKSFADTIKLADTSVSQTIKR